MRFHTMRALPVGAPVFMEPRNYLARTLNTCTCASCRHYRNRRASVSMTMDTATGAFDLVGHPLPAEWDA